MSSLLISWVDLTLRLCTQSPSPPSQPSVFTLASMFKDSQAPSFMGTCLSWLSWETHYRGGENKDEAAATGARLSRVHILCMSYKLSQEQMRWQLSGM